MNSNPGHAALRKFRFDERGRIYVVTTTTHGRQPRFSSFAPSQFACQIIDQSGTWTPSRLLGWVLMPDHWHGLIELGGSDQLAEVMRRFKGKTARAVNQLERRSGSLWAAAFHDHALRSDEDVCAAARYLVNNPVRAGLVERVEDYPFWNSIWLDDCSMACVPAIAY